jgi:hypothetical protein
LRACIVISSFKAAFRWIAKVIHIASAPSSASAHG